MVLHRPMVLRDRGVGIPAELNTSKVHAGLARRVRKAFLLLEPQGAGEAAFGIPARRHSCGGKVQGQLMETLSEDPWDLAFRLAPFGILGIEILGYRRITAFYKVNRALQEAN